MEIKSLWARAKRGIREEAKLYLVSVSSLTVAFLCLAVGLLGLSNLSELAERWGRSHHMSVYLRSDATHLAVEKLETVLRGLAAVERVEHLSSERARARFLSDMRDTSQLSSLPAEAFPASVEVKFHPEATEPRIEEIAERVAAFTAAVDEVDTYRSWFQRLGSVLLAARAIAGALAALVLLCVFAVVANTIRLAVENRREEIEVLRMCGATDNFVRGPFVLEGALQGFLAALLALLLLSACFVVLRAQIDEALGLILGTRLAFLSPLVVTGMLVTGTLLGALSSVLSVRRYMTV